MLLRKKQKGFGLIEIALSMAGLLSMISYTQAKSEPALSKQNEVQVVDGILHIVEGARNSRNGKLDGYTSVTMTTLSADELVPVSWGDGSGANPAGGDYTFTGTANNMTVTATGLSNGLCTRAAEKLNIYGTAACATGTVTLTAL